MEPERLRNPLRVTCGKTRRGKPRETAGKRHRSNTRRGSTIAYPTPSRRRERETAPPPQKDPHTHTGTTRDGEPQLKPTRPATAGYRQAEDRQTELKKATP